MTSKMRWMALAVGIFTAHVHADVRLPATIGHSMVIQQKKPVRIWGAAEPGEAVSVSIAGRKAESVADAAGRFAVELPALDARQDAGPHEMVIVGKNTITLKDILVGEVWLCGGQSNMRFTVKEAANAEAESAAADYPQIRFLYVTDAYSAKPEFTFEGRWIVCSPKSVYRFTATGYYFGRELHKALGVPIGLVDTSRGWSPAEAWVPLDLLASNPVTKPIADRHYAMAAEKDLDTRDKEYQADVALWKEEQAKAKADATAAGQTPSTQPTRARPRRAWGVDPRLRPEGLYNAMLAPLVPMQLAGVVWYQGESNSDRAQQYRTLLPMVIDYWRTSFKSPDLPFGIVQLPQHVNKGVPVDGTWAELREAQLFTHRTVKNTGLVVTMDIGEPYNIHPLNKQDVGKRLANWALSSVYGQSGIPSSPLFKSSSIEGNRIRVAFDGNFAGLVNKGELTEFYVAGEDRKFVPAKAQIDGKTVIVWSDEISKPAAARYAWIDSPKCALFSIEGLPATPFRTDDWPGITDGVTTVPWQ